MSEKFICAECGEECKYYYLTVRDNFLIVKYFEDQDGLDNIFCSDECLQQYLSVDMVSI